MNRLLLIALLILGTTSLSGCANGPIRTWLRGAPCGSSCGATANTAYYGSSCPECGSYMPGTESYDSNIILPPTQGTLPAPGPGN